MKPSAELMDLGLIDYGECWRRQEELFDRLAQEKAAGTGDPSKAGYVILCEHPHVYTLGKSGHDENLLIGGEFLKSVGASFYRIDRGGDITYHGPGQIVGYPILDLEKTGMGLKDYIRAVEQSVIEAVEQFGISAGRIEGKAGVWISDGRGERKICAIGVRSSRFITMHGFALNVATDLKWFGYINPCGLAGGAVTSMNAETGGNVPLDAVKKALCERISVNMNINI